MAGNHYYTSGDWLIICDVCGKKMKASHSRHRWDGFIVCDGCFEHRHPQDLIRTKPDKQSVPYSRPPNDVYIDVTYIEPLSCTYITKAGMADIGTADCSTVGTILQGYI